MPKISKTSKVKKTVTKKKTPVTKTKEVAVKKKTIKKPAVKKVKKSAPKKTAPKNAKQIVVDIISDDEAMMADFQEDVAKITAPVFSSWPNFNKKNKVEDILEEMDDDESAITPVDTVEYDKQKKFFSDWAMQNAPQDGAEKPTLAPKKSVGLYRRQAVFYLGATLILLLAVAYFFFVHLTIIVSPQGETINDSVSFDVAGSNASSTATSTSLAKVTNQTIDGSLQIKEVSAEKTYQTSADNISNNTTTGEVTGMVTLINKYNKTQPLVATTRLLSPDGKLFRLKTAVSVPAGGTVTAEVYADKPGADMAIDTITRFTIPGLWAGIQDRIYAENDGPLTYQIDAKRTVKQSDIEAAKKDINEVLDLKIKNDLQVISSDQAAAYSTVGDDITINTDAKVGDQKSNFTVTATKKIVIATFSKDKVIALAKARLSLVLSDDKQLSNFNTNQIIYSLENFDDKTQTAEVKAYFTGTMSLKSDASLVDSKKLVGLNEQQISQYLNTFPEIKDYQLEFWPSFIKTAPNLPDRINIKIN